MCCKIDQEENKMSLVQEDDYWTLENLPFYYTPLSQPTNGGDIPDTLPIKLYIDRRTGTLMQRGNPTLRYVLNKAYLQGSLLSGVMDSLGIGRAYTEDFLTFIQSVFSLKGLGGVRVLEIGCGHGYLLHRLQELGADVLGIEPGLHGEQGAAKYNIPIVRDYYPTDQVVGQFDCIIMYNVLEHFEDPVSYLKAVRNSLTEDGKLILAVEDEEPYIVAGDISILFHEHFSYFTRDTLNKTLAVGGFGPIHVEKTSFCEMLYASASNNQVSHQGHTQNIEAESMTSRYRERANTATKKVAEHLLESREVGDSVGIYVPGRAVNVLAAAGVPCDHVRFFDDNPKLHKTYFPGIDTPIESRQQLIDDPPEQLLIMSRSFGRKIALEISPVLQDQTDIRTWEDIFL